MLFVLGGNGTHAGALAIHNEVRTNLIPGLSSYTFVINFRQKVWIQVEQRFTLCESILTHIKLCYYQCHKRGKKVVVVGVPKTIDNDILLMDRTFGFDTAVEEAQKAINAAYIEVILNYKLAVFISTNTIPSC